MPKGKISCNQKVRVPVSTKSTTNRISLIAPSITSHGIRRSPGQEKRFPAAALLEVKISILCTACRNSCALTTCIHFSFSSSPFPFLYYSYILWFTYSFRRFCPSTLNTLTAKIDKSDYKNLNVFSKKILFFLIEVWWKIFKLFQSADLLFNFTHFSKFFKVFSIFLLKFSKLCLIFIGFFHFSRIKSIYWAILISNYKLFSSFLV